MEIHVNSTFVPTFFTKSCTYSTTYFGLLDAHIKEFEKIVFLFFSFLAPINMILMTRCILVYENMLVEQLLLRI